MLRAASLPFPIPPAYTGQPQPYLLSRSGIPFVGLSSGSVSAAGAITAITALPRAYPKAFCYFPANALATTIAAGWYYCTFSTTTAGTAFLNTYTSGSPTIPASPTAVTDGKGAFTGDTGEEFGPTITVPGGALGLNGVLRGVQQWSVTNSAGAKTLRVRFSGNAGTVYYQDAVSTVASVRSQGEIWNSGVAAVQVGGYIGVTNGAALTGRQGNSTVDTASDTTLVISMQRGTATDNAVLEAHAFELLYGA